MKENKHTVVRKKYIRDSIHSLPAESLFIVNNAFVISDFTINQICTLAFFLIVKHHNEELIF